MFSDAKSFGFEIPHLNERYDNGNSYQFICMVECL
jgi:hypothetical protein